MHPEILSISLFWFVTAYTPGPNNVVASYSGFNFGISKTIPHIGKFIVGSDKPYKYLIDSIDKFYNQKELSKLIKNNGFSNVEFRNVSNGISAIHSGWKI